MFYCMQNILHLCRNMKKAFIHIFIPILLIVIVLSCTNNNTSKEDDTTDVIENNLTKQVNVQNFFNTIPSANEVFEIIRDARLNYNESFLNNPVTHKNYSLERSQALNLGVYGADLAISGAFEQTQESMLFLKCTNYLAHELGISSAFDENTMNRFEMNKDNRDSTLEIISQAFKKADKIFSENKRGNLSVLMIAGAFIESMYVAGEYATSKITDSTNFNKINTLYFKQQESLQYLINLLQNSSDIDDVHLKETLSNIHGHLKKCDKNIDEFKKAHGLMSELRKRIISVY
ncbi:MAG: hypothetical protein KatS3mg028_1071 [Bacteroidia bacterium]|nr:MAG: hypothetical protein KatS3mg028_1071 [Bacteroidia bacterium]